MGRARGLTFTAIATATAASACLFPSLDGLNGAPIDGGSEATVDASADADAGLASDGDATVEAGMCPPNDDPTLVAYYPFDEGAGSIAHDCSGHGFDAVIAGTDTTGVWTPGHRNDAIRFASANQICVVVGSSAANQSGGPLTAVAWFNMASSGGGGYIVGQRHQTGYAWRIDIETDDAGAHLGFAVGANDDAGNDFNAETLVQAGSWHHVAAVFDPSGPTQAIYLDGVQTLASSAASVIVLDPIASTIRIGCRDDDSNYFDGVIDEVRVYSRALTATEIATLASL